MDIFVENWEVVAAILKIIGSVLGAVLIAKFRGTLRAGKPRLTEDTVPVAISDIRRDLLRENVRLRKRNDYLEQMAASGASVINELDINAIKSQIRELRIMMQDMSNKPAA